MHTVLCVCPPRVGSLFPPVLSKSCNQFPLGFKVWFSRNSFFRCRTPRLGSLTWGSEPLLQWVDFCGISVRQSVNHPPTSYRIWFYCDCAPPTISLWLLLCLWMWGICFGEFQCLPVDDCPAASCDSGVFARGSESTSFYSAILVPPPPGNSLSCSHLMYSGQKHFRLLRKNMMMKVYWLSIACRGTINSMQKSSFHKIHINWSIDWFTDWFIEI